MKLLTKTFNQMEKIVKVESSSMEDNILLIIQKLEEKKFSEDEIRKFIQILTTRGLTIIFEGGHTNPWR